MDQENQISISSLFLEPKGRIVTDFQLLKPQQYKNGKIENFADEELWLKVPKQASMYLEKQLKTYSFKKDF